MIIKISNKPYELATKEEVMKEVTEEMSAVKKEIFENLYPVGSVYISLSSTFDPNTIYNGTWELIKEGIFLEATTDNTKVGAETEAGLPNLYGEFDSYHNTNGNHNHWVGLFSFSLHSGKIADSSSTPIQHTQYYFNASKYNSIYGKSTTVQPHSIKAYMWRRIG